MIKFGTSGFRGIMGDNFTKENVQKIAYALNKVIEQKNKCKATIAIAYDNRFMSENYAQWFAEVSAMENKVIFFNKPAPSALACWMTKKVDYGIVITASHNPYIYNGIKIFLDKGKECDDEFASLIEEYANACIYEEVKSIAFADAIKNKSIEQTNMTKEYCDEILSFVDVKKIRKSNISILANAMHGNSVESFNYLFEKLNIKKYEILNSSIDPYFEHKLPTPYVYNLTEQAEKVVKEGYDVGIAVDGDSDRFALISSSGKIYDCNFVVAVLYYYYITQKGYKGSVVKNNALSNLVKLVAKKYGFSCYDSKVGFKHIAKFLSTTDCFIGVETNGIAMKDYIYSKDGIFVAIAMIDALVGLNCSFDAILNNIQDMCNFHSVSIEFAYPITEKKKKEITEKLFEQQLVPNFNNKKIDNINRSEGVKIEYDGGFWGMFRFSGNEPVIRIFSEMHNLEECNAMIKCYENFIGVTERQK